MTRHTCIECDDKRKKWRVSARGAFNGLIGALADAFDMENRARISPPSPLVGYFQLEPTDSALPLDYCIIPAAGQQ